MKGDILKSMFRGAQASLCGVATLGCGYMAKESVMQAMSAKSVLGADYLGISLAFVLAASGFGLGVYRSTRNVSCKKAAFASAAATLLAVGACGYGAQEILENTSMNRSNFTAPILPAPGG